MRRLVTQWYRNVLLAVLAGVLVTGCATLEPPKSPQDAINKANILLIATASTVRDNVRDGIMTKAEGSKAIARVERLAKNVDEAQHLLNEGLELQAQDKIKLVNTLLTSLQREIAQKAREAP